MRTALVAAATTRRLRRDVLRPGWPDDAVMHGDEDPEALHVAAFDGDEVVGACVLLRRPFPGEDDPAGSWQLRGMATTEGRRGQGIGAHVLGAAVTELTDRHARLLWCEARDTAVRFYAAHGFETVGDGFRHAETGIPHHLMRRPLPG